MSCCSNYEIRIDDENAVIRIDGTYIGRIVFQVNPCHMEHLYLDLQLQSYDFAFVERNEIAYVYGTEMAGFVAFAQNLITGLFEHNEFICFEADDCDEYAMELKKMFTHQTDKSFDTYIL